MKTTKNSLFLLGLIISTFAQAQTQKTKIKAYYFGIQNAEFAIVNNLYKNAEQFYNKAFELKYPNDKDLYNAFLVSYYNHDSARAAQYINELSYKGLEQTYFKDSTFDYTFYQYLYSKYDSCKREGNKNPVHKKWSAFLKQLKDDDQKVRAELKDESDTIGIARMIEVDSINCIKLMEYIAANGFPSFEQVGYWDGSDPFNGISTVFLIAWHNRYSISPLDSVLEKAVINGDFRPDEWATILSARDTIIHDKYFVNIPSDKTSLPKKEIERINQNRARFYLEDYESYKRNRAFAKKNYDRRMANYNPNLYPSNESVKEQFILCTPFELLK